MLGLPELVAVVMLGLLVLVEALVGLPEMVAMVGLPELVVQELELLALVERLLPVPALAPVLLAPIHS